MLSNEWPVQDPSTLRAANTAALAAIGVRPDTLHAMKALFGVGEVPKNLDMDGGLDGAPSWAHTASLRAQVGFPRAPLTAGDQEPQQRAALENALVSAFYAHTPQEFGAALKEVMQATGRTQGDIVRSDSRTEKKWLSKSTVSRMVNGATIARRREQVEAFVSACGGIGTYVEAWGLAWVQFRDTIRAAKAAGQDDVTSVDTRTVDEPPVDPALADHPQNSGIAGGTGASTEDDALLDVHVRVTKQHLLQAAPMLVAMGLLSTADGRLPSGRELVVMALLGGAAIAVFGHMQRLAQADNTSTSVTEHSTDVYMTGPRQRDV